MCDLMVGCLHWIVCRRVCSCEHTTAWHALYTCARGQGVGTQYVCVCLRSEWVSNRGMPAPYGVVSHRCVPFFSLYMIIGFI